MCGFVSIIHKNGREETYSSLVREMNFQMLHRGPDSEGYYEDDSVSFGFRRLSIIDLEKGGQPLSFDNERYWIVFNGEIYNYIELREELVADGYSFATSTDTEVILGMYKKYGKEIVSYLRGMFAFVIWDKETETIFGARDHFGIKPLYFAKQEDVYYFASESKVIEKALPDISVNTKSLQQYFTFQYAPGPDSMINGIEKVTPGYYFEINKENELSFTRYFTPMFNPTNQNEDELAKKIRNALFDSVEKHMRSDVVVGSFLSGGVDSSIIVSIAREFSPKLKTISVGFEREGYSEIDVAEETAEKLGVANYSRIITSEDFMNELEDFVWYMDDPLADPAAVPQYFLSQEARKQCKVALSGEGADELFAGYTIYNEPNSLKPFKKVPRSLQSVIKQVANVIPDGVKGKSFLLRGTTPIEDRFVGNAFIFDDKEKVNFLKTYDPSISYQDVTRPFYEQSKHLDDITRMQYIDMNTWLIGDLLHNADETTMASTLELRTPFIDKKVFEIAATIPSDLKLKNGTTKYILRKAVEGVVPDHVLYRKKLGFPVPIRHWLKDEIYDWTKDIINSSTDPFIDKAYSLKLLEDHKNNVADNSRKIWTIIIFMKWYKIHVLHDYVPHRDLVIYEP